MSEENKKYPQPVPDSMIGDEDTIKTPSEFADFEVSEHLSGAEEDKEHIDIEDVKFLDQRIKMLETLKKDVAVLTEGKNLEYVQELDFLKHRYEDFYHNVDSVKEGLAVLEDEFNEFYQRLKQETETGELSDEKSKALFESTDIESTKDVVNASVSDYPTEEELTEPLIEKGVIGFDKKNGLNAASFRVASDKIHISELSEKSANPYFLDELKGKLEHAREMYLQAKTKVEKTGAVSKFLNRKQSRIDNEYLEMTKENYEKVLAESVNAGLMSALDERLELAEQMTEESIKIEDLPEEQSRGLKDVWKKIGNIFPNLRKSAFVALLSAGMSAGSLTNYDVDGAKNQARFMEVSDFTPDDFKKVPEEEKRLEDLNIEEAPKLSNKELEKKLTVIEASAMLDGKDLSESRHKKTYDRLALERKRRGVEGKENKTESSETPHSDLTKFAKEGDTPPPDYSIIGGRLAKDYIEPGVEVPSVRTVKKEKNNNGVSVKDEGVNIAQENNDEAVSLEIENRFQDALDRVKNGIIKVLDKNRTSAFSFGGGNQSDAFVVNTLNSIENFFERSSADNKLKNEIAKSAGDSPESFYTAVASKISNILPEEAKVLLKHTKKGDGVVVLDGGSSAVKFVDPNTGVGYFAYNPEYVFTRDGSGNILAEKDGINYMLNPVFEGGGLVVKMEKLSAEK